MTSYDPSAPYRAMMMPSYNPTSSQRVPPTNIDPKTGVIKRIPQFYYPRYDDDDDPYFRQPYAVDPREINPNLPPVGEQSVPNEPLHYAQPAPYSTDPYASGHYYPYSTPYLLPMPSNMPSVSHVPIVQEQSKSDVIAAHKKDGDLSRLEVYHFAPKQNTSLSTGTAPVQPIVQYHVYPPPLMPPQQQRPQLPSQPSSWYDHQPNVPPYAREPSQPLLPPIETKARSSQTEPPSTKNRGVSPITFAPATPIYDDDGYPYVHQKTMHTDRYDIPTGRINRRVYESDKPTPLPDCRCLDCQRERARVLNYYPD